MTGRAVSPVQAILGLVLAATIALPLGPGGQSLLELLLAALREHPANGAILLIMLGSPHLFGLAVAFAGVTRADSVPLRVVLTYPVAIMQAMLVMFAVNVQQAPVVAPRAILGFALVSGLYLPYAAGAAAASSRERLGIRWYVRWGALLIAGTGLWLRLQAQVGLKLGPAVDVALAAAVLLLASLARRDPPEPPSE
ncbi:MAG: hypothetical protein JNL82_27740 [Myxococcales bacterium]|nr:hypothetical protein [Myxococcales bacterium]